MLTQQALVISVGNTPFSAVIHNRKDGGKQTSNRDLCGQTSSDGGKGSRGKLGDLHTFPFFLTFASFNIFGCNIEICVTEGWLAILPLLIYSGTLTSSSEMTTKNVP